MGDRYRGYPPQGRSIIYNPARSSLPSNVGYSSLHAGDVHIYPDDSRSHPVTTPRGYSTSVTPSGVPTTTRTYAITHDPRPRHGTNESGRSRRSTLESSTRPPVIVTTTSDGRPAAGSSHSSGNRNVSPSRNEYPARGSRDGHAYSNSASSFAGRGGLRPSGASYEPYEYARHRDRDHRDSSAWSYDADAYRQSRPHVTYPSDPRHNTASIDYGEDGYTYTNPGEVARYKIEKDRPARRRRRESLDRGYYRPSFNYSTDPERDRKYALGPSRPADAGRGGPPPSTRGFDKLSRAYDDPRDGLPLVAHSSLAAPKPQYDRPGASLNQSEIRRSRPVSLYQDPGPRSSYPDDLYRSREDQQTMRDLRSRDVDRDVPRSRSPGIGSFHDDSVADRGFGIRTSAAGEVRDPRDHPREPRREHVKRFSDDDLVRDSDSDRERRSSRIVSRDDHHERRSGRRDSDEDHRKRLDAREKMAAGLGTAATAAVLTSKAAEIREQQVQGGGSRRSPLNEGRAQGRESPDRDRDRDLGGKTSDRDRNNFHEGLPRSDRPRKDASTGASKDAGAILSDSDGGKSVPRRRRLSHGFDPNDTTDLKQLKEQLAAQGNSGEGKETPGTGSEDVAAQNRTPSSSPPGASPAEKPDEHRGRQLAGSATDGGRAVRVVSPPRGVQEEKPVLKGILKTPRVSFPEEENPVREGVAPHKDDKKFKEAPPGAKWTKLHRRIVNPEALEIGKERFEVQDDHVIVLRVLDKDEIHAYAAATAVLRGTSTPYPSVSPCSRPPDRAETQEHGI